MEFDKIIERERERGGEIYINIYIYIYSLSWINRKESIDKVQREGIFDINMGICIYKGVDVVLREISTEGCKVVQN